MIVKIWATSARADYYIMEIVCRNPLKGAPLGKMPLLCNGHTSDKRNEFARTWGYHIEKDTEYRVVLGWGLAPFTFAYLLKLRLNSL